MTTLQSGLADAPVDSNGALLNAEFAQRPDRVPGVSVFVPNKNRNQFWNSAAFAHVTTPYVWGNARPGTLRGPSYYNADWSVGKSFAIKSPLARDLTTLEVRWESFNVFNHTNLGSPINDINNNQFGQIFGTAEDMRRNEFEAHLAVLAKMFLPPYGGRTATMFLCWGERIECKDVRLLKEQLPPHC